MAQATIYEGVGETLEAAMAAAEAAMPPPQGKDYRVARVVDFGIQRGGFTGATVFWARCVEEPFAEFKT